MFKPLYKILYLPTGSYLKRIESIKPLIKYKDHQSFDKEELLYKIRDITRESTSFLKGYSVWVDVNQITFPCIKEHFEIVEVKDEKENT